MRAHNDIKISPCVSALLRSLAYADVFRWPLSADELATNGSYPWGSVEECSAVLTVLEHRGVVQCVDGLYSVRIDPLMRTSRKALTARAVKYARIAKIMGRIIALFPFTRMVCVSGSLSKSSMCADGDIDWFIVTHPGRLWMSRTLLIAFKKIVLLNSKRFFCINYMIDAHHMAMRDHDIYTATEIVTLIPIADADLFADFVQANTWLQSWYPAWSVPSVKPITRGRSLFKRFLEGALGGAFGDAIERWCQRRWKLFLANRYGATPRRGLRFSDGEARYQPDDVRDAVLRAFEARYSRVKSRAVDSEVFHG